MSLVFIAGGVLLITLLGGTVGLVTGIISLIVGLMIWGGEMGPRR